jgi:hypothetical protein
MKKIMFLALALAGCAATISSAEQVKIRAAHDFKCDANQVQTVAVDDNTMRASACGQERTYVKDCVTAGTTRCTWVARGGGSATNTANAGATTATP